MRAGVPVEPTRPEQLAAAREHLRAALVSLPWDGLEALARRAGDPD